MMPMTHDADNDDRTYICYNQGGGFGRTDATSLAKTLRAAYPGKDVEVYFDQNKITVARAAVGTVEEMQEYIQRVDLEVRNLAPTAVRTQPPIR